ncbi:MAG: Hsp20/alpha crystallin family protein [Spirochaetales bacterium]|nr:Hsp20/alpha crystallin family protein [Spirochaetales bacterium]
MTDKGILKKRVLVYPAIGCDFNCSEEENDDVIRLVYKIPGVKKENIHLKVIKDALRLIAHKDDTDYINEFYFQCEVDAKNIHAEYENGILTLNINPLCQVPLKKTSLVKIN